MAFTVEQAKLMRAAYQRAGTRRSDRPSALLLGHVTDASNYLASGAVGQVTAIRAHMYRNTPHGKPQWTRPVYPDMTPENDRLAVVPRRARRRAISMPTATSTGACFTITPAATCTRACRSSSRSGTK